MREEREEREREVEREERERERERRERERGHIVIVIIFPSFTCSIFPSFPAKKVYNIVIRNSIYGLKCS